AQMFVRDPTALSRMTAVQRKQVLDYLSQSGISVDDVMNQRAQAKLSYAEAQTLGRQKANLDRVEHALTDPGAIADEAMQAAQKLKPSDIRLVNSINQLFQRQFSSGPLADYRLKMLALRDEFATVINRGGAPTEGSRQQATEEMDKFQVSAVPTIVG